MALLKQSAARVRTFLLVLTSDHLTGATGASPTVTISKNGAAFAGAAGAVAELTSGWYTVSLTTVDTNTLGDLAVHVTGTAADPSDWTDEVVVDVPGGAVASVTGAVGSVTGAVGSVTGSVGGSVASVTGNVGGNVVGSVASVTARVTANTDQLAGQTVTAGAGVTFPSSVASPTNITAGTITTVTTTTTATNLTNLPAITANWITAAGITAGALNGKGDWNVGKTGYALSAAGVQAIWDALTSALTTAGSIGKLFVDNLNATITSRMASYTQPTGFLAATFPTGTVANTTNITAGTVTTATNLTNAPTSGDFTAAMKTSLNAATPASVVGAVGSVTGAVGSIGAGGITAASFGASAIDAAALATDAGQEIADRILARNIEGGSDAGRTIKQALARLRNRIAIAAGTMTVYQADDSTTSFTAAVTTTAGNPVSEVDPS